MKYRISKTEQASAEAERVFAYIASHSNDAIAVDEEVIAQVYSLSIERAKEICAELLKQQKIEAA